MPSAPTGLVANANSNDTVSLSWSANPASQGVTGYNIYREAAGSTSATLIATVAGTTYTDAGSALIAGSSWTYYLTAVNATGASAASAAATVTLPQAGSALSLTLTFSDGSPSLSFSQSAATDIGSYLGPFVQQRSLRQRQGPWTVFFRPDANGSRQEVVVEYGTEYTFASGAAPVTLSGAAPAHITAPYTATISGGGLAGPVAITVPNHWWGARWRWQSAPRPCVRAYAELLAMKAVLPLSTTPLWNTSPPAATAWAGPMSTGDVNIYLATTGDRDELGFITEQQACYLLTGNAAALESMLTDAEASGTMIYHIRDAATGAPFSVESYPNMALVNNAGPPGFAIPTAPMSTASNYFSMVEGVAHMPALGFAPWLLTDDPFFLEEAQFAANYDIVESNYFNINDGLPGLVNDLQTRAWAWGMRDLFRMAAFAPASPPAWLAPQSYWQQCVADNLTFAGRYLAATASPCTTVFNLIPDTGNYKSFMVDYLGVVIGWAGWSGLFPAWANAIRYASGPRIAMSDVSGASGWDYVTRCPTWSPLSTPISERAQQVPMQTTPSPPRRIRRQAGHSYGRTTSSMPASVRRAGRRAIWRPTRSWSTSPWRGQRSPPGSSPASPERQPTTLGCTIRLQQ